MQDERAAGQEQQRKARHVVFGDDAEAADRRLQHTIGHIEAEHQQDALEPDRFPDVVVDVVRELVRQHAQFIPECFR